jgi:arylsulfatase A-like enzyme
LGFGPLPKERFVWDGDGTKTKNYGSTSTDWGAFPEVDSLMPDYKSTQWAIERLGRAYKKPFFMGIGYLRPHVPLYVPQKWFDMHPIESIVTPPYKADDFSDIPDVGLKINDLPMMPSTQWAIENGEWKKIIQAYLACISFVDHQVGDVIKALESSEHANNTIVLLWSDHGYRMGEKSTFTKHCLWEEATNAPLMISGLDLPKDKDIDMPVEMLSIYPTLLELCGLPPYNRNEGESLVKYIRQNVHYKRAVAITTFGMQNHSIRSENYRYIQYEDGSEELYDHKKDPNEWYNLASLEEFKSIKEELKAFLPTVNVKWTTHSSYKFQPYFVEQKERMLKNNQK